MSSSEEETKCNSTYLCIKNYMSADDSVVLVGLRYTFVRLYVKCYVINCPKTIFCLHFLLIKITLYPYLPTTYFDAENDVVY